MNAARLLLAFALLFSASGCSTISDWIYGNPPRTVLRQISVESDLGANAGNATMIDIVFVYEASAVAQLPKTGPEWFRQKDALQRMLATGIDVVPLQVPAGFPEFNVSFPDRAAKAIGVYALANYLADDGQSIANLTAWHQATIRLLPKTIHYSSR